MSNEQYDRLNGTKFHDLLGLIDTRGLQGFNDLFLSLVILEKDSLG